MKTRIAKWGNSVAVRLPKPLVDELGLKPGQVVEIGPLGSGLGIATAQRPFRGTTLARLMADAKPDDTPASEDWGLLPAEWPMEDWSDVAPEGDGPDR